jgi:thiol-disulfide isomerase/thioredoxin
MNLTRRRPLAPPASLALLLLTGCGESFSPQTTTVSATPPEVLQPQAATPTADAPKAAEKAVVVPTDLAAGEPAAPTAATASATDPRLLSYEKFRSDIATNPKAKLTMVDAWATWCGPCKENFPHLVAMHEELKDRGLAVASLSFDDPTDAKALADAKKFLASKNATFPNIVLDAESGAGFDLFNINGIPAVFLYGPDGKEIRRFTMDNPDRQFTYDQVESVVKMLLDGKTLPNDAPGDPPPAEKK